jgi:spore cortex formation protein SpoVR/YcgB (stage V sporulation)
LVFDNAAMHQKNDVVSEPLRLAHVMGHKDYFDATPLRIEE